MKTNKIVKIIILILWMILIFILSNQTGSESQNLSDTFISKTICNFINNCNPDIYSFIVRKLAHFTIYFILGIFSVINFKNDKEGLTNALIICITYAFFDEIHQMFINNRSGEVRDVLIDSISSLLSIILVYRIRKKRS